MALIGPDLVNEITIGAAGPGQVVITQRRNGDIQVTVGSEVWPRQARRPSRAARGLDDDLLREVRAVVDAVKVRMEPFDRSDRTCEAPRRGRERLIRK